MKKFFAEYVDAIIFAGEVMQRHRWITTAIMAGWLLMTIVLNTVYYGKPVPISHIVLKPVLAYANVILTGCTAGFCIGYVNCCKN